VLVGKSIFPTDSCKFHVEERYRRNSWWLAAYIRKPL